MAAVRAGIQVLDGREHITPSSDMQVYHVVAVRKKRSHGFTMSSYVIKSLATRTKMIKSLANTNELPELWLPEHKVFGYQNRLPLNYQNEDRYVPHKEAIVKITS